MLFYENMKGKKKYNLRTGRFLLQGQRNRRKYKMKQFLEKSIIAEGIVLNIDESAGLLTVLKR